MGVEISVVLITCDRVAAVRSAVESLLAQQVEGRWNYELIVVDDGSADATPAVLEELRCSARVPMRLLRTAGLGVPGARNLGARAAEGRWMACFDDDQIASPFWLQELRLAAEQTGGRCVGGALSLRLPGTQSADPAQIAELQELGPRARALLGEHLPAARLDRYTGRHLPASNNALIERELFFAVGGFDEAFRQGGSDTDLFRRMRDTGENLWFAPRAIAEHVLPARRLTTEYLRWTGLKVGAASARILLRRSGFAGQIGEALLRCSLALLRDLPRLCWGAVTGNDARVLESRCSLWYTQGLLRGVAGGFAPQLFGGARFLHALDFRRHGGERS